ncbi:hypothetical protein CEXT_141671 [Caerostris extrusa]|uniref:Uncharacterized protein n=1 Tax=Caerostris extrusa TaxID=172846 RepID=A0AAV4TMF8_CAEEX|nr:hypothetical protein CEXT_141671 [Caerostris extrusa]
MVNVDVKNSLVDGIIGHFRYIEYRQSLQMGARQTWGDVPSLSGGLAFVERLRYGGNGLEKKTVRGCRGLRKSKLTMGGIPREYRYLLSWRLNSSQLGRPEADLPSLSGGLAFCGEIEMWLERIGEVNGAWVCGLRKLNDSSERSFSPTQSLPLKGRTGTSSIKIEDLSVVSHYITLQSLLRGRPEGGRSSFLSGLAFLVERLRCGWNGSQRCLGVGDYGSKLTGEGFDT